jgi:5'-nucleotidase / UDP-sugar diphosphatase
MQMRCKMTALLFFTAALCSGAALWTGSVAEAARKTVDLVVLHVNDSHGALHPHLLPDSTEAGGIARAATLIKSIRSQNPGRVLVLHGGDVFSRGEPLTIHTGGRANLKMMERTGFDVMTPGNGEFYFGVDNLIEQTSAVAFDVIHANAVHKASGTMLFPPYTIREVDGVRIGILGLGMVRTNHYSAGSLTSQDPIETARRYVPELRKGADLVILLSHLGLRADSTVVAAVPDIDLIVGGHSHTRLDSLNRFSRGKGRVPSAIAQARHRYEFLGRVDLRLRKSGGKHILEQIDGRLIPITDSVPEDPAVKAMLDEYTSRVSEVVGVLESSLASARAGSSPLAHLAAEAVRSVTRTDIAAVWRGTVISSLNAGPVTVADICRVHRTRTPVLAAKIKGAEIGEIARTPNLIFAGCEVQDSTIVRIAGVAVDTAAQYTVSAPIGIFLSSNALKDASTSRTGHRVDTALERYLRQAQSASTE